MERKIKLHDKSFRLFIPNDEIESAIDKVAARMNADFSGKEQPPILVCVLNGSILYTAELMKRLDFDAELLSIRLSSYEGTNSTGFVREVMGLSRSIEGKEVIILEDIVDTGATIETLVSMLMEKGAASVKVSTLLLKKDVYKRDIPIDYAAIEIPTRFIVGFGLDYNELGRNLKDIYVLDE